ncbi:MAG TPA: LytR C-terminal domain-containing protein [Kineosporiaceae bacterium]|nr:LytR C-terminal domain-containing protein [Kineosporiaceae bacterium]
MTATRPPAFDDRFSTPIEASRRGAHRARPKPASAGLPVAAGVAVVVLVLGGGYVMLKGDGNPDSTPKNLAAESADADPQATGTTGAKATSAAGATKAAAGPTTPPTKAPSKVNRDIRFKLLNSTSIQGLAKRIKTDLEGDGWTIKTEDTGNSLNRNLSVTKIYFGKPGTKATAVALKKDLGFGTVVRDASALTASDLTTSDLAVVLGTDAQ